MLVRQIFDDKLAQYAYLIGCPRTGTAAVVDPQRDIDRYFALAEENGLRLTAAVDTHIHADYLSGLRECAERGLHVYASDEGGDDWRYEWLIGSSYPHTLLKDGDRFTVGNIVFEALHTPGHTPEHMSYLVHDTGSGSEVPIAMATGDFVFVGDVGRPDLLESAAGVEGAMEPGARVLYQSVEAFRSMPEFLQVWPGHGAGSACGKALGDIPVSTVGYELRNNASIQAAENEDAFVRFILSGQPEPPMYFSRMKRENKLGPRVLGGLPRPRRLTPHDLGALAGRTDLAVVDARRDRSAFMAHHLPGAIYAPFDKSFPTIVGSYVEAETPIYLILEDDHVEEAVRDLIRIGLDDIVGYAAPETLLHYQENGGTLAETEVVSFADVRDVLTRGDDALMLDVRGLDEYESGHVPGARHIAHTRLFVRRDEVPTDRPVYVYCRSGNRAAVATALLERHGVDARHVDDKIAVWHEMAESDLNPA